MAKGIVSGVKCLCSFLYIIRFVFKWCLDCVLFGWQWNFRVGFTPREGLVIHSIAYVDGSRGRRPIAHRLSFVEMVVPYGDPNEPHYRKNAFDAGEDGLGKNAHSLKKVSFICISCLSCNYLLRKKDNGNWEYVYMIF